MVFSKPRYPRSAIDLSYPAIRYAMPLLFEITARVWFSLRHVSVTFSRMIIMESFLFMVIPMLELHITLKVFIPSFALLGS